MTATIANASRQPVTSLNVMRVLISITPSNQSCCEGVDAGELWFRFLSLESDSSCAFALADFTPVFRQRLQRRPFDFGHTVSVPTVFDRVIARRVALWIAGKRDRQVN